MFIYFAKGPKRKQDMAYKIRELDQAGFLIENSKDVIANLRTMRLLPTKAGK